MKNLPLHFCFQNNDTTAGLGQFIGEIAAEDAVLVKVVILGNSIFDPGYEKINILISNQVHPNTNWAVHAQNMARGWKFWI